MNRSRQLRLELPERNKHASTAQAAGDTNSPSGTLSPEQVQHSPPSYQPYLVSRPSGTEVGNYILYEKLPVASDTPRHNGLPVVVKWKAYSKTNGTTSICKVIAKELYLKTMQSSMRVGFHENIEQQQEIILGEDQNYVFFQEDCGDLHEYVRVRKRIPEDEARNLFQQLLEGVKWCHESGVLLRDLKLRKITLKDFEHTQLQLTNLDESLVIPDDCNTDILARKHGCPAYVSPEIITAGENGYSGKAADMWAVGVILYIMVCGRYPFHDPNLGVLFQKIRIGSFVLPDYLSCRLRCLLRHLLCADPSKRLTAEEALFHRWFTGPEARKRDDPPPSKGRNREEEQVVPMFTATNGGERAGKA